MPSDNFDPYAVLGVATNATYAEIKERRRVQLSMKHPDHYRKPEQIRVAEEDTVAINDAWYILSDPTRRREYDETHFRGSTHVAPPHPFFRPALLDFGNLPIDAEKTIALHLHNDGGPADTAQLDLSAEGSWFSIDIADPANNDSTCLKVLSVTARGPGGHGTLNEWVSVTLDGVMARADLRITAMAQAPRIRTPVPPHSQPAPESTPRRVKTQPSTGTIARILLVIVIIGAIAIGIVSQVAMGRKIAARVPIDTWIPYRDTLVARINQGSSNPFHLEVNNDLQLILMQITREQMNSSYINESNVNFMRDLFARTGPCRAPTDFWHCRWYPVAMHALVLDRTDLLVTGFMRSPYPSYSDRNNTDFAMVFRRAGIRWLLLPPPTYRDPTPVNEVTMSDRLAESIDLKQAESEQPTDPTVATNTDGEPTGSTNLETPTITISPLKPTCIEHQSGREDNVACNDATAPGYYWRIGRKLAHYSVAGVVAEGGEPACNASTLSTTGMTARFPLEQGTFRAVSERYVNRASQPTAPKCNYAGLGNKMTDADLSGICGIFEVTCAGQP